MHAYKVVLIPSEIKKSDIRRGRGVAFGPPRTDGEGAENIDIHRMSFMNVPLSYRTFFNAGLDFADISKGAFIKDIQPTVGKIGIYL